MAMEENVRNGGHAEAEKEETRSISSNARRLESNRAPVSRLTAIPDDANRSDGPRGCTQCRSRTDDRDQGGRRIPGKK